MKTVVHVLPYMAHGGTEKHVLTLLRGFQNRYRSILLAPKGEILDEFTKLGVEHIEFPELKGNVWKKAGIFKEKLCELAQRCDIGLVHVHAAHEFVALSRRVLQNTPILFHLSAHQGSFLSKWFNYKLSAVISKRKADLLIAVSDEEKRIVVKRGFPPERVVVVHNGYGPGEGDDEKKISELKKAYVLEGSLIIGNLGRFHKTKRLDLLIRAFALLKRDASENLKLVLIGDGPERQRLEETAVRLGVANDTAFLGFFPRGDRLLRIFDIFVLPTTFEGSSNVLAEAMAKGLPIVTTDIPSVRWMFENGRNALLFKKNNLCDLASKLVELSRNEKLRKLIGEGAFQNFRERFDSRIMVEKIAGVYRDLMGE